MLHSAHRGNEILVSLANAGVQRNGRWLVRGVEFSVSKGEIVTLIGPNGSGKSTSAKMAIGVVKPTEGEVSRIAGLRVGYVPQKLSVDWTMPLSVRRLMTLTGPLPAREIDAALNATGIAHLANAEVQHLPAASSSARFWPAPSPVSPICWFLTSPCRVSISPVRLLSMI